MCIRSLEPYISLICFTKFCISWSLVNPLAFKKFLKHWLRKNKDSSWEEYNKCQKVVFTHMKTWLLWAQTNVFYHWFSRVLHLIKFGTYMCGAFWSLCYCAKIWTLNQYWNTKQRRRVPACPPGESSPNKPTERLMCEKIEAKHHSSLQASLKPSSSPNEATMRARINKSETFQ